MSTEEEAEEIRLLREEKRLAERCTNKDATSTFIVLSRIEWIPLKASPLYVLCIHKRATGRPTYN